MDVAKVLESSLERLEPTGDYNQSLAKGPAFEVEQDFFDWDMAVTGLEDMRQEIRLLIEAKLL